MMHDCQSPGITIAGANAGLSDRLVEKSLVVLSPWPGMARLGR